MMKSYHAVNDLHMVMAHAVYEGFPEYEFETRDWSSKDRTAMIKKKTKHTEYNLTVRAMFPQVWGSTALGFGGIGGQTITTAYTTVVESDIDASCCVYFGGQFAYRIEQPNEQFREDLFNQNMVQVSGAKKRYERTN
jgi:hypothetical protein